MSAASHKSPGPVVKGDDLTEFVKREDIHRIIVTMGDRRGKMDVSELLKLKASGIQIQDAPDCYDSVSGKIPLESLCLSWLLFSLGFHVRSAPRLYKRIFSLTFGLIAVVLTAPFMALAAIAIRLDSEGPIIFRRKRVGEYGMPFTGYRFRTKYDGDKVPTVQTRATSRPRRMMGIHTSLAWASGCGVLAWTSSRNSLTS